MQTERQESIHKSTHWQKWKNINPAIQTYRTSKQRQKIRNKCKISTTNKGFFFSFFTHIEKHHVQYSNLHTESKRERWEVCTATANTSLPGVFRVWSGAISREFKYNISCSLLFLLLTFIQRYFSACVVDFFFTLSSISFFFQAALYNVKVNK